MRKVQAEKIKEAYDNNLAELNEKEMDVLSRFYGLDGKVRHTLQEIGDIYGVTRERIRQIKAGALEKIGIK